MSRDVKVNAAVALGARNLLRNLRTPMLVAASLAQPVIWLVLFSQIFGALAGTTAFRRVKSIACCFGHVEGQNKNGKTLFAA